MTGNTKEAALRDPVARLAAALPNAPTPELATECAEVIFENDPELAKAIRLGLAILDENDRTLERALDEALPFAEYDVGNLRASLLRTIE